MTFVAPGTCVIDANQAGDASYQAAPQVQQSFAVVGTQTITFTSTSPNPAVVGGTYAPIATGGPSGNPVSLSIDASSKGSCSLSGATVTFVAPGTCVIDANQAGNASYQAAPQVQQSFAVVGTQTVTFTSTPPSSEIVGGTYTPTATGGASGNPVTFSIDASSQGSCSISGATVTFVAAGTCVVDANQAGNASYQAAPQVQQSVAPGSGTQNITFSSTAPNPALVGGTYTATATGGASGNPVTFSVDASSSGICTISGVTVSFVAVGICVIDADQDGNANYAAAAQVQQSVDLEPGTQTITFTSTPPSTEPVGGTFTATATGGSSGNPVTFSVDSSSSSICTISGATVTFVAAGICVIDANQAGNANFAAAAQVQQSVDPDPVVQTISFTSTSPNPGVVGGTYVATATGGASGNPVTFSIDPSANGSCSMSGGTVTFASVGTCVVDANQAGNAIYGAATQVQQSFGVIGTQTVTFTSTSPNPAVVGGTYTPVATGGASGNPVSLSIDASSKGSCSLSGARVTFVAPGTCVIDANQAGDASYQAAPQVQQSFAVVGTQTITFTSTSPNPAVVGGTYAPIATGGPSGNPVSLSIDASSKGSCSLSGATVTFVAPGTCVIDANQAGNASYQAAPQVQQSFAVVGTQTVTFTSTPPSSEIVGGTYTPTATGGASGNPVTFSIDASSQGSCSISGATVTFVAAGTCVVDANQAGNASYQAAPQVQQSVAVSASSSTNTSSSSVFPIAVWLQDPAQTTQIESGYSTLGAAAAGEGINTFEGLYDWPSAFGVDNSSGGQGVQFQAACNAGEHVIAGGDPSSNTSASSVASVDKIAAAETQAGTTTSCSNYLAGYDWSDEPAQCSTNVPAQVATIHAEDPTRATVDNMAAWVTWGYSGCASTANADFAAPTYPSSDDYHNTDPWNTGACKAAAHVSTSPWADCSWLYGYQGAVQTSLAGGKPTWEYIETGTDELGFSSQNGSTCSTTTNACSNGNEYNATAPQVNADAWSAILNGVDGIEWFCHGTAQGQNLSDSDCMGGSGTASNAIFANLKYIDGSIQSYAPELLSPTQGSCTMQPTSIDNTLLTSCSGGDLSMTSSSATEPIVGMTKVVNGTTYLFVEADRANGTTTGTYSVAGAANQSATLVYDSRGPLRPCRLRTRQHLHPQRLGRLLRHPQRRQRGGVQQLRGRGQRVSGEGLRHSLTDRPWSLVPMVRCQSAAEE